MAIGKNIKEYMQERPIPDKKEMVRKTLYLNKKQFQNFDKLCDRLGKSASKVVDRMIEDFINEYGS